VTAGFGGDVYFKSKSYKTNRYGSGDIGGIGFNVERMVLKVVDAINPGQAGTIIDQSEEQVRDDQVNFGEKWTRSPSVCWKKPAGFLLLERVSQN